MSFVDDREGRAPAANGRRGRRRRRAARWGVAASLAVALSATTAAAAPLDEPFVGGLGFNGPTSGSVAAIYWNPAALGLVHGTQILISGNARLTTTTVNRASIYSANGMAGGSVPPGSATASNLMQPLQYPIGPGAFMGISSDLGGDRFTIGFATYMPSIEQTKFALTPANDEPTRYQALQIDLRNLALVPALSVRFGDDLHLGIAPGFLFSTGEIMFDEDTALDRGMPGLTGPCGASSACGAENPAAAARYDVRSGTGFGDSKFSFTLGGGLFYRLKDFDIGVSYQSRPIGSAVPGVEVAAEQSTAYAPGGAPVTCPTGSTTRCVFGDLAYRLPDIWIAGFTWHLRDGLEVSAMARWIWFHVHDRIDVRLTGPTLEASGLPEHIVIYRGFQDVWDVRGRVSYWFRERLRLGAQLRLETSAVDAAAVNAGAVDGLKIEPMVLAEGRLTRHLWVSAGYGVTLMRDVTANPGVFDPTAATTCVEAGNDLDNKACAKRNAGLGRPTAAGTYSQLVQDFGLAMTAKF